MSKRRYRCDVPRTVFVSFRDLYLFIGDKYLRNTRKNVTYPSKGICRHGCLYIEFEFRNNPFGAIHHKFRLRRMYRSKNKNK